MAAEWETSGKNIQFKVNFNASDNNLTFIQKIEVAKPTSQTPVPSSKDLDAFMPTQEPAKQTTLPEIPKRADKDMQILRMNCLNNATAYAGVAAVGTTPKVLTPEEILSVAEQYERWIVR
jgi:hypothetical protein